VDRGGERLSNMYEFELPPKETIAYYFALAALGIGVGKGVIGLDAFDAEFRKIRVNVNDCKELGTALLEFFADITRQEIQERSNDAIEVLAYRRMVRHNERIPLYSPRLHSVLANLGRVNGFRSFERRLDDNTPGNDYASVALSFMVDLAKGNIDYMKHYVKKSGGDKKAKLSLFPTAFRFFQFGRTRGPKFDEVEKSIKLSIFGLGLAITGSFISLLGAYVKKEDESHKSTPGSRGNKNRREKERHELYLLPDGSPSSLLNSALVYEIYHRLNSYGEEVWEVLQNTMNLRGISADLATYVTTVIYALDALARHPSKPEVFDSFLIAWVSIGDRPNVVWMSPFPSTLIRWDMDRKIFNALYSAIREISTLQQRYRRKFPDETGNALDELKEALATCMNSMVEYSWTGVEDYRYLCTRALSTCIDTAERKLLPYLSADDVKALVARIKQIIYITNRLH